MESDDVNGKEKALKKDTKREIKTFYFTQRSVLCLSFSGVAGTFATVIYSHLYGNMYVQYIYTQ